MKRLLQVAILLVLASQASAQIVAVHLTDSNAARKYRGQVVELKDGGFAIIGEPKTGIEVEPGTVRVSWSTGRNELFVADPKDPRNLPYEVKDDEVVPKRGKKGVVAIQGEHILRIRTLINDQSLYGLSLEYVRRRAQIDETKEARDQLGRKTDEWQMENRRLVHSCERLQAWLARNGFVPASEGLSREVSRYKKALKDLPARVEEEYRDTTRFVSVPDELVELSEEITGGSAEFRVQQSKHVRITYMTELPDSLVVELLELAESVIGEFRQEFVDPYTDEDFKDYMPEGVFKEFWFGPSDTEQYARFCEQYYGVDWGPNREHRLKPKGSRHRAFKGPKYLDYWRLTTDSDYHGIIVHGTGHALANIHFNADQAGTPQAWLAEGVSYYMSLEFLDHNTVTCKQFRENSYVKQGADQTEKSTMLGTRNFYNILALSKGSRIDQLALKRLSGMTDGDLAKSWSYFDFVARELGKEGQVWLRQACDLASNKTTFINTWRIRSESLFDNQGGDVFSALDRRWRDYAENAQETGESVSQTTRRWR